MSGLLLVQELYEACNRQDCKTKRLTFSPNVEGYSSSFVFSVEDDDLEIVIFKSTIKKIFQECHEIFEEVIQFSGEYSELFFVRAFLTFQQRH